MRASLMRTGSIPVQNPVHTGSPRISLSRQASFTAGDKNHHIQSPKLSLHFHSTDNHSNGINRSLSETAAIRSPIENLSFSKNLNRIGSQYFPLQDTGFGGGSDHGDTTVTTGGNGGDRIKIGAYYEEMLKSNPTDALLLRNYGKFLHEVEKNMVRAEEYYGRAILANPEDGELLSLYGKLIWETNRDEERAKSYFDQAIHVAPDDSTVLGSYAHFMWEAEEEEDEVVVNGGGITEESMSTLISAF
ncbi:TPR domain protein [Trifolium pratense]|uniref:TPR domain protein n=1 Tax=Trifolium pratense TaxID=57577 RepID=A0A2K3N4B2_TRIPR|nr:TPR domain protein [Trifolium pratense]PNX98575.1 TPR domain protein [Trifolium pratense]PNX98579.1 TPR domain protein [Trifolium pratense]PNY00820.1 TPR domain protein [Trifolium pratense]